MTDQNLGHKTKLYKFKRINLKESTQYIFTDHKGIKLVNDRKSVRKFPNIWKLKNTLLNNPRFKGEVPKEIKINT